MIDLHCHIHAGVDDGCASADETLALGRAFVAAGVTKIACTSHVRPDKGWMNTRAGNGERLDKTRKLLADAGIALDVVGGAEHYMDAAVFGSLDTLADVAVPYGDGKWLLVETPYLGEPPNLMEILHGIRRRGFRILVAHAERFPYLSDKLESAQRLVDAGVAIQVNLGSLAGAYNRAQQKNAERLLKEGLVSVLAGDCHREYDVDRNIVKGLACARKMVGDAAVRRLTVDNPQHILDDAAPERVIA